MPTPLAATEHSSDILLRSDDVKATFRRFSSNAACRRGVWDYKDAGFTLVKIQPAPETRSCVVSYRHPSPRRAIQSVETS